MTNTKVNTPRLAPMVLALLAIAPQAQAQWRVTPSIGVTETFTDNAAQQSDELARSQWVTEVTPGIALQGGTRRLAVNAVARFHQFLYSYKRDRSNLKDNQPEFHGEAQARMVDDWLYLDTAASKGVQSVSAFGPQITGNLWASGNRAEVTTWRVSPYLRHRFGTAADLTVRYTRDSVDAGRNLLGSSEGESVSANLSSGPRYETLGWSLDYFHQDLDNKLAGPSSSDTAIASLRLRLVRSFALTASSGYDRYDFQSLGGRSSGRNWSGGFLWTPSSRTSVQASWGRRYFGPSGSLAASLRTRHSVWSVNYSDMITTTRAQFLLPASIDTATMLDKLFTGSFPDPVQRAQAVQAYMQQTGLPSSLADSVNYFSNRYMRQKQAQVAGILNGAHGSLMLSAFASRRDAVSLQQTDSSLLGSELASINDNTTQRGVSAVYNYRLSPRTNAMLSALASRTESLTTGYVQDNKVARLGMTHKLSRRAMAAMELRHARGGTGAIAMKNYTENAVSATVSIQF
jgi:uncharacterized protein (PEP-CTERM system associated)